MIKKTEESAHALGNRTIEITQSKQYRKNRLKLMNRTLDTVRVQQRNLAFILFVSENEKEVKAERYLKK